MYKTTIGATFFFYAIIIAIWAKVMIEDAFTEADWEYCHQYTSCADSDCCIQATAEKEEHLKYD